MVNPAAVALALMLLAAPTPSSAPPRLTWDAPTTLLSTYAGGSDSPPTPWDPLGDFGCRIANGNVFQLAAGEPVPAPSRVMAASDGAAGAGPAVSGADGPVLLAKVGRCCNRWWGGGCLSPNCSLAFLSTDRGRSFTFATMGLVETC